MAEPEKTLKELAGLFIAKETKKTEQVKRMAEIQAAARKLKEEKTG